MTSGSALKIGYSTYAMCHYLNYVAHAVQEFDLSYRGFVFWEHIFIFWKRINIIGHWLASAIFDGGYQCRTRFDRYQ